MAQFTVQGRWKLLFNGDGVDPKDPFHYKLVNNVFGGSGGLKSHKLHKGMLRLLGYTTSKHPFSSLMKGSKFDAKASLNVSDEGIYYDSEFGADDLACFRGLVLDISYRPINVVCWKRAICLEFMEKADVLEYYDQTVNSPNGSFYIPAVLRIPHLLQVVRRRRISNNLSRKSILFRDNFTCHTWCPTSISEAYPNMGLKTIIWENIDRNAHTCNWHSYPSPSFLLFGSYFFHAWYCSAEHNLTIDHVLPMARGGEWKWENLVAACAKCNSKKGSKTPQEANMKLLKVPKAPKDYDILAIPLTSAAIRMLRKRNGTPEEWLQYLCSSTEP